MRKNLINYYDNHLHPAQRAHYQLSILYWCIYTGIKEKSAQQKYIHPC